MRNFGIFLILKCDGNLHGIHKCRGKGGIKLDVNWSRYRNLTYVRQYTAQWWAVLKTVMNWVP